MEIPNISIPEIQSINVPIFVPSTSNSLDVPLPNINLPGCVKTHRDVKPTNTAIVEDDVNGSFYSCPPGYELPSYVPIEYNPKKLEIVEQKQEQKPAQKIEEPKYEQPQLPKQKEEKKKVQLVDCPGDDNLRVGQYASELKLEIVVSHRRSDDGLKCYEVYESVPFISQYLPPVSTVVSTTAIGLIAASSPALLSIIKPLVKKIVGRFSKKSTAEKE
tara:strand:+ start:758 stop:1408 length:651 start_codon:yes stop_codon:yes gene_type:complete